MIAGIQPRPIKPDDPDFHRLSYYPKADCPGVWYVVPSLPGLEDEPHFPGKDDPWQWDRYRKENGAKNFRGRQNFRPKDRAR